MAWSVTEKEYQYLLQKYREQQLQKQNKSSQPIFKDTLNKEKQKENKKNVK